MALGDDVMNASCTRRRREEEEEEEEEEEQQQQNGGRSEKEEDVTARTVFLRGLSRKANKSDVIGK